MDQQDQFKDRFKKKKKLNIGAEEATRLFQTPKDKGSSPSDRSFSKSEQRPSGIAPPEQVHINNLADLYELVKKLKPSENSSNDAKPIIYNTKGTNFASEKFAGHVTIPQSGGDSTVRQSMIEGFEMIQNHHRCYEAQNMAHDRPDDFGGFLPAKVPNPDEQITWLDGFINRRLGGSRNGLFVVWDLVEGQYQMNPWTCEISPVAEPDV